MFCTGCGAEVAEGSRFCRKCGAVVLQPIAGQSDAELEALAARGDRDAFAELYNRHFDRVYDFLRRMLRDADEAADLAQETFLRAMRSLSPKERKASFSTWLFTIARNLALNRLERRRRTAESKEAEDEPLVFQQVDTHRFADPEEATQAQELSGLVWQAAAALNPKEYSLLDLHVRQGLDSAEIAEVLGVSKGNAYTMMSRLKDAFEGAVAAVVLVQRGRRQCDGLSRLLEEQRITVISPAARRLIDRHVAECATCQEQRRRLVSPTVLFGALAAMPIPFGLKPRIAEGLMASWAEAGAQAVGAGLKGFLSQPTARVASLPAAWKGAIIGGLLIAAVGGGLGGWVGVGGGLPGLTGGERSDAGLVPPSPTASPTRAAATPSVTATALVTAAKVVFQSSREPKGVYMMDADGRNVVRIGTGGYAGPPLDAQWSPDGLRVAFHECPDTGGGFASLYVMDADGTGLVQLAQRTMPCGTEGDSGGLSWSPDGTEIVFLSNDTPSGIYVVNADGTNLRYLTDGIYPAWSPLGDSIAFRRREATTWRCPIYSINADGSDLRLLTAAPCEGSGYVLAGPRPKWSPDGSMLTFSANEEPSQDEFAPPGDIFVVRADGSGLTNTTNDPADDRSPLWIDCDLPTAGCEARVTIVAPDQLNVRGQPGTEGEVVGQLSEGDVVCLTGSPFPKDGYKWWPVHAADGTEGWAAAFDPKDPGKSWITPTDEPCSSLSTVAAQPLPTPPSEVTATELITVPLEPDQELVGSCWTGSIALPLPHAWRCSSDNRIYDPCLSDSPTDTFVICTGNPFNPLNRVEKLNLTEPLPVSQANRVLTLFLWRLELADGALCDHMLGPTGTVPEDIARMRGAGIRLMCDDGWYVAEVQNGDVWVVTKVQWSEELDQVIASVQVPVRTVWR